MLKRTLMGYDEGYACCSSSESDQMDPGRPCRFFTRGGGCDYRQDCAFWHDENDDARLVHWDERIDRDFRDATSTSKEVRGYGISEATLRLVAEDLASRTLWPLTGISVKDAVRTRPAPWVAISVSDSRCGVCNVIAAVHCAERSESGRTALGGVPRDPRNGRVRPLHTETQSTEGSVGLQEKARWGAALEARGGANGLFGPQVEVSHGLIWDCRLPGSCLQAADWRTPKRKPPAQT